MKRIKLLGLALLAIFALSAVASSVATAEGLPEILPVPTPGTPLTFTSELVGTATLTSTALKNKVVCQKAKNAGQFTTQDHGTVLIEFTECEETTSKAKCKSTTGAKNAGEIWTEGLIEFVTFKNAAKELQLGLWLEPFLHGGEPKKEDLKFTCGVLSVEILGSLIAVVDNESGNPLLSLEKVKLVLALWKQTNDEQEPKTCELLKALCEKGPFELKAKFKAEAPEELAAELAVADLKFKETFEVHF